MITKTLENQITTFIDRLESYNKKLRHPRNPTNYEYLQDFFVRFIKDNNSRALEVANPAYQKIRDRANALFPVTTLWNLCIDGRVLSVLAHGASAGIGSSIRVPGGILREFVRGTDGKLHLKEDSDFAQFLSRAYISFDVDCVAEIFDSHVSCAARLAEEQFKGREPKDFGLLADISHKLQMAQATEEYVTRTFGEEKSVIVILTSFDPHNGYMYMGLETKDALAYVYKHDNAYTQKMLLDLVADSKIISTEDLIHHKKFDEVLKKYAFRLDWKKHYVDSAQQFWLAIEHMKKDLLPLIKEQLLHVYPHLASSKECIQNELEERAMLLLTNTFSGFLNNYYSIEMIPTTEDTAGHRYPYGIHSEEGVRVSEGGYPPYEVSLFTVFSYEEENLPSNVELATSLVRKNRKEGRVAAGLFPDPPVFAQASIPIIVQEIIRDTVSNDEWDELSKISWDDMPHDWDTMDENAFFAYLQGKGIKEFSVGVGINNLRKRMAVLYFPYNSTSSRIIEHYSVALPVVADKYRMNHFIVPFVKLGFD